MSVVVSVILGERPAVLSRRVPEARNRGSWSVSDLALESFLYRFGKLLEGAPILRVSSLAISPIDLFLLRRAFKIFPLESSHDSVFSWELCSLVQIDALRKGILLRATPHGPIGKTRKKQPAGVRNLPES